MKRAKNVFGCIVCSMPDLKNARKLAGILLSKRLVACVQILPKIESHYWWNGKKTCSKEVLILAKTTNSLYKKAEHIILKNHSYEVPEILWFSSDKGSKSYTDWIKKETGRKG